MLLQFQNREMKSVCMQTAVFHFNVQYCLILHAAVWFPVQLNAYEKHRC